jgi:hypothetical protein
MEERIIRMAVQTWETIGPDIFQLMRDQNMSPCLTRAEILEAIADADYMLTHGGDKEAYEYWDKLPSYEEQLKILEPAMPCAKQCG